jgi:Na+-translocating ferredoxin:NAD+ oxidoreductase subunit G
MTGKDILKITLNLVVIYMIGGIILAMVYAQASPIIFRNNEIAKQEALKELMPDADTIDMAGEWSPHDKHAEYFIAKKGDDTIGYVVQSFGKGYSSYIDTLTSVDMDFKVQKINILHHGETPGLGDEIELDYFKDRLRGKGIDQLKVLKTETTEYVEAISGATISTRAVTEDAVKNGVIFLMETLKEGGSGNVTEHGHN